MAGSLPGIVVRILNDAGIIAPPVYERYPVIIGEGDPYKIIRNQRIVRSAGWVDTMFSDTDIHEIVSVGDLPGITNYQDGTDYTLVVGTNTISWNLGGDVPTLGNDYYVTFTETRAASAYQPMLYFDENLIYADHGEKTRTNGNMNDVSIGGSLALNAGAKGVIIAQLDLSAAVDPDIPTSTELENAFIAMRNELSKITDYKLWLVPMSSGTLLTTTANNIFFNHAIYCSQPEKKQERSVLGVVQMGTSTAGVVAIATAFSNERMVVPFPYGGVSGVIGFSSVYDTRWYCAALAGKMCSVGIGIEISDEIIPNVTVSDNYTPAEFEYLIQHGVSPAKVRGDVVRNIMCITTDGTSALTESVGVQDIKDYVKKYWREGLWAAYKNKPTNNRLLALVQSSSEGILRYLESKEIIAQHKNVAVSQDIAEPRKLNVSGQVKPAYGLQWMDVTFTFVLSF